MKKKTTDLFPHVFLKRHLNKNRLIVVHYLSRNGIWHITKGYNRKESPKRLKHLSVFQIIQVVRLRLSYEDFTSPFKIFLGISFAHGELTKYSFPGYGGKINEYKQTNLLLSVLIPFQPSKSVTVAITAWFPAVR